MRSPLTSGPVAETLPPTPSPRRAGSRGSIRVLGGLPARTCVSTNVTPASSTSMVTSPGPGNGSGTSATSSTCGGPKARMTTARTPAPSCRNNRVRLSTLSEQSIPNKSGRHSMAFRDLNPESSCGRQAQARRNDLAVLEAARDVFSVQGADAPISAVAERAGVGMGTLYRRYGSNAELLRPLRLALLV